MRVLWLTSELPSPVGAGSALREWHMVLGLAGRGDEVVVVAPVHESEREGARRLRETGVDLRAYDRPASRRAEALRMVLRRPGLVAGLARVPLLAWQVDVFWTAMAPLVERAFADGAFDAVVVCHDWAVDWVRRVPPTPARKVLLAENLTWVYYANRARSAKGVAALAYRAEAGRWLRYDRRRFDLYDTVVTVSEHDAEVAAGITSTQLVPIPGGVDTAAIAPAGEPSDQPTVIFTGTLRWPPNAEGLRWLLSEIWPRVRRRVPGARLFVVGSNPSDDARALADDSVEITGRVPELAPYFGQASVVVVPILSGAGIRLKFLDALASGRGVVSTRMGAEGVLARDGEHALFADDADAFADAVATLLEDPERRREMGAAARALAEERYDWRVLRASFERVLDTT